MMSRLMMGLQVILVLMFFKGIDADENFASHCLEMLHFHDDTDSIIKLKETTQQKLFCRNMTGFFDCINNVMREYTGVTLREFANLWYIKGTESKNVLNSLVKLEDYVEGKCRNETQLNTDLSWDILCYQRGHLEVIPGKHCKKQSAFAYLIFTKFQPERELSEKDNECILTSYELGCIATTVREKCGVEIFNRFKGVLKRTDFFRSGTCSSDLKQIMKTTFLQNLKLSESEKNIYRTILDVKRRRR